MSRWQILHGDVRERLKDLEPQSVQCVVTSPPYFGLRDYGVPGQIGMEPTPREFTAAIVSVFAALRPALADDGVCWLNMGDSYAGSGRGSGGTYELSTKQNTNRGANFAKGLQLPASLPDGYKQKDLIGVPWMVAFALREAGWYLRSDIIWSKPNPMPESVQDRPTKAHEYIFLLTKSARYYYDADAIREIGAGRDDIGDMNIPARLGSGGAWKPATIKPYKWQATKHYEQAGAQNPSAVKTRITDKLILGELTGRNRRSVWTIATQPYPDAHFATFPEALVEPCILAGSKEGDLIVDPFAGSGTTGAVAIRLQRNFVGIELNADYVQLARKRIGSVAPLLAQEIV